MEELAPKLLDYFTLAGIRNRPGAAVTGMQRYVIYLCFCYDMKDQTPSAIEQLNGLDEAIRGAFKLQQSHLHDNHPLCHR